MPIGRLAGPGLGLVPTGQKNNIVKLRAGGTYTIPGGPFMVTLGPYSCVQFLDPITATWRTLPAAANDTHVIDSDGVNYRVANLSGCAVGAIVTNAGSAYTSAPLVTPSAGGSLWRAVLGGLINTTQTPPTQAGVNYTYPPMCVFDAPPAGGVQATATCTISAGAVNAITVTDQGGGYTIPPNLYFITDPRDPNLTSTVTPITPCGIAITINYAPAGYMVTAALTGSGTIAAVLCTDPGNVQTSVPTLAFSGGGGSAAAATMLMNFTVTAFTVTTAGVAYGASIPFGLVSIGGLSAAAATYVNPAIQGGITQVRPAAISGTTTAGGAIQTTGSIVVDGGIGFQVVPTLATLPTGTTPPTTLAQGTATVGGVSDACLIQPM